MGLADVARSRGSRVQARAHYRQALSIQEQVAPRSADTRVLQRERATEGLAKRISRHSDILHFACHAYTDERDRLNSTLVLTIPERFEQGQDNGILQAWELMESVRLKPTWRCSPGAARAPGR